MNSVDALRKYCSCLGVAVAVLLWSRGTLGIQTEFYSVNQPIQITSEADPVLSFSVSLDGKQIAFVSKKKRFPDLWLRSIDPAARFSMRQLTDAPALESDPAFSKNGRYIAFVSTQDDAKGDIFVIDLRQKTPVPVRITGKETEDGAPSFGPGETLFFHRKGPEMRDYELVVVNIGAYVRGTNEKQKPVVLPTQGDATFPSVSPDGLEVAFVSTRNADSSDIFVMNLKTRALRQLTTGPFKNLFPRWSLDGRYILFSRWSWDTNGDETVDERDHAVLYRVLASGGDPYPLTSARFSSIRPVVAENGIYFLSDSKGIPNCRRIPSDGQIPRMENPEMQLELARNISLKLPRDPYLTFLAYHKVLETYFHVPAVAVQALYSIGLTSLEEKMPIHAVQAFEKILSRYPDQEPEASLARIQQVLLKAETALEKSKSPQIRMQIVENANRELDHIAEGKALDIRLFSDIERARLLSRIESSSASLLQAIHMLDTVIAEPSARSERSAEAMVLKGDIYRKIGNYEAVYPVYLSVIQRFSDVPVWADTALERMLDLILSQKGATLPEDRIQLLKSLADQHRTDTQKLAMGALNRVGDILYAAGEWSKAKAAYHQVIDQFPVRTTQTAAARFALAEILYQEQRFREALDLYENEIHLREKEDRIRKLARSGFIQKSIEGAEYFFDLGEIDAARSLFKEIIEFDGSVVEAHRGYIKCAATQMDLDKVLSTYRTQMTQAPADPIVIYALGLGLSYREDQKSLKEARELLERAILLNGQIGHFHRTLGYVLEVLETVYGQKGGLEAALESYQKAFFLTDPADDPKSHAELNLNLGNVYFLLGQYAKAFYHYDQRLASKKPIPNLKASVLFYKRLGTSAFQIRKMEETINAFTEAIRRIDSGIDTQDPSTYLNRDHRYVMDRIVTPALRIQSLQKDASRIAEAQADANRALSEIQARRQPPPGPAWKEYREKIQQQIKLQETLNQKALALAKTSMKAGPHRPEDWNALKLTLSLMLSKAKEAILFPEQLIELKVEMLDRLGLAYQEAGRYPESVQSFEQAFALNEKLGFKKNLALNLRSIAFTRYLLAERQSGEARIRTLQLASKEFARVVELVDAHGVPSPALKSGDALIRIDVQTALNEPGATQSGKGFSKTQEKRLAEAFMSRISIELGEIETARKTINSQTASYAEGQPVSDADAYGVALLFHRAGHLAASQKDWKKAYDNFLRSGELTLHAAIPLGSYYNTVNLSKAVTQVQPDDPDRRQMASALETFDAKTLSLLTRDAAAATPKLLAGYHNAMGVYLASMPASSKKDIQEVIEKSRRFQYAMLHFSRGIRILEEANAKTLDREEAALLSTLHLNLGRAALELAEDAAAADHFQTALNLAESAILPDIQWRALIALRRHEEALKVLESVTAFRAGCAKGEILDGFFSSIKTLVESQETESALNLLEKAAELERFNRLAPLILRFSQHEKRFFIETLSRLDRIDALQVRLSGADPFRKKNLESELTLERTRLADQMGEDNQNLPDFIRLIQDDASQISAIRLVGLSALAESMADEAVRNPADVDFRKKYTEAVDRYQAIFKKTLSRRSSDVPSNPLVLFGPESYEAIDIMETLPEGGRFVRIFKSSRVSDPVISFILTADQLSGSIHGSLEAALKTVQSPDPSSTYLAFDYPDELPVNDPILEKHYNFVLSAAHFMRSFHHKKLFKRIVVRISSLASKTEETSLSSPDLLPDLSGKDSSGFHVLVVDTPVFLAQQVPTRPGAFSTPFAAVDLKNGERIPLLHILNRLGHASIALLEKTSPEDAFWIGHLFSIYGCPTLVLPAQSGSDDRFADAFLKAFRTHTAGESLNLARSEVVGTGKWMLVGFSGMTLEESKAFARSHFESYITSAKRAFDRKQFGEALILFENAVDIASETDAFRSHLLDLYPYARESAYLAGDPNKALDFSQRLVKVLEMEQPTSKSHAEALLRLGLVQAHLEMYAPATETMSRALKIYQALHLSPQQAETLSEMAWVAEQATDYEAALSYFESSVSLTKDSDPRWRLGDRFHSIGRIFDLRLSQYAKAIANYQKAASLYREGEQSSESTARIAQTLLDVGRCYRLMGNLSEAEKHYEQALNLLSSEPAQDALRSKILIEQANNAWYQARYEPAFRLQQKAWAIALEQDLLPMQVIALNTSGPLWWALGDNEKALAELNQALEIAKRVPHREDEVATTLNNIGMILRETGRFPEALDAFKKALSIDKRLRSRWAMAYDYRHIGVTHLKMGFPQKAIPLLTTALNESRAIGNRIHEAKALLDLADAHLAASNPSDAGRMYQESLTLSDSLAIQEIQWRALYGQARIEEKARPEEAIRLLKEAVGIIESIRSNIRISRLKDGFLSNKLMVYETLCRLLADSGKPVEAFEMAERSRSRNFIDLLGSQSFSLDPAMDRRLYDRYHALKERIETLKQQTIQNTDAEERKRQEALLKKAISDLETVMIEIQASNPRLSSLVAVEPLRATELQQMIEPGVALISYYMLENELFCWRILPQEIRLFRQKINRKNLEETLLDFRRRIQNLEPFEKPSHELYDILIKPVLSGMDNIKRLGIIPHGHLHYLSFATLSDGTDFLIDRFPIFYLPSASVLKYTKEKRISGKNLDVLAIGNPDLGNLNLDLPFSEHEVHSIQWNFPKITILTKERATEKWVVDNIDRFGIIHLASHGEFDPVNPLLSAIKLAKEGETDGNLEAAEIFGLKLSADLVVLSACQTGLGKITAGDDVIGLNRAFLYAGTHAIISSLWRVSDISTAMMIKTFYREYVDKNKAESLRLAALHVKNRYPHPGYWGAFTLVGDYE